MKIKIKVHTNCSQEKIEKVSDKEYEVWIKDKPIEGKANVYLEKFLKKYFKSPCRIVSGFSSKIKFIEVEE